MSRARLDLSMAEREEMLRSSMKNNECDSITGLLLCDGYQFLQVLEGEDKSVDACWERIRRDSRHFDIVVLEDEPIAEKQFGHWDMNCRSTLRLDVDAFKAHVIEDVADVTNMPLKALFIGFASMAR